MARVIRRNCGSSTLASAFGLALCGYWSAGMSQETEGRSADAGLEEIVVTAQLREQSVQEVPVTVSVLGEEYIRDIGADRLADYVNHVPGMAYFSPPAGNRSGQNIAIRGILNTRTVAVDSAAASNTTSMYINQLPVTPADLALFDVDRIEVLKGPQGTLHGAAAMGGTVKIFLNQADAEDYAASVEVDLAGTSQGDPSSRLNAMLNIPLVEGVLGARAVGYRRDEGGFVDLVLQRLDQYSNQLPFTTPEATLEHAVPHSLPPESIVKDANTREVMGGRLSFLYTPNDRLTVEPSFMWQSITQMNSDGIETQLNAGYTAMGYVETESGEDFTVAGLEANYDFGPFVLTSATGFSTREYVSRGDSTASNFRRFGGTAEGHIASYSRLNTSIDTESFTQELRLNSPDRPRGSGGAFLDRMDWVVGAFYVNESRFGSQLWTAPGHNANAAPENQLPRDDDIIFISTWFADSDTSKALFGNVGFDITDALNVSVGVRRYEQEQQVDRDQMGPLQGADFTFVPQITSVGASEEGSTYRFAASYSLADDLMVYGSTGNGFRAGGGVVPVVEPECAPIIEAEGLQAFVSEYFSDDVTTYEVGIKSAWAGERIVANAAVYQTDWTDLQQSIGLDEIVPGSTCTRALIANVGAAEVRGFELQLNVMAMENLQLRANYGYTSAEISETDPRVPLGYVGAKVQDIPESTASFSVQQFFPGLVLGNDGYARLDYTYKGSAVSELGSLEPQHQIPSWQNVNFRAGVQLESARVELYVDNVLDEEQIRDARGSGGSQQRFERTVARPRTVGLTLSYQW